MDQILNSWETELAPLVLEQYKESPNYLAILQKVASELDEVEAARCELATIFDIDSMVGSQLDLLGLIAVTPREQGGVELPDAEYRTILWLAFKARRSGTIEEIIAAVKLATKSTTVLYIPEYPAGFFVIYDGPRDVTQEFLNKIAPAGVGAFFPCFLVDAYDDPIVDATGDSIMIVGPCTEPIYPTDRIWDGGTDNLSDGKLLLAWPFQDGTGIGEFPDAGTDAVSSINYTFKDGTFADDMDT